MLGLSEKLTQFSHLNNKYSRLTESANIFHGLVFDPIIPKQSFSLVCLETECDVRMYPMYLGLVYFLKSE